MRIITETRVKNAMNEYPQWKVGLNLWLLTFRPYTFQSYQDIKTYWKEQSGWNVDRVSTRKSKEATYIAKNFDLYIFDIHKTNCRILTRIDSSMGKIFVLNVLSHAEYDKWLNSNIK